MAEINMARTLVLGAAYQAITDTRFEVDCSLIDPTIQTKDTHARLRLGAERFLSEKTFSLRAGYDDLLGDNGFFALGAGYHPAQPLEISYALRLSRQGLQTTHYLSLIYRLDKWTARGPVEGGAAVTTSSIINLLPSSATATPSFVGRPVSSVPLRKLAIQIDPPAFSPEGKNKAATISFPGDNSPDIARWTVEFQDTTQKVVRHIEGTGLLLPQIVWDGLDDVGKQTADGKYQIVLKTLDKNNDLLSMDSEAVEMVSPRSRIVLRASGTYFSTLGGRQLKKDVVFTVDAGGPMEVQNWQFEVREASSGNRVAGFQGKNLLPSRFPWDGRKLNHEIADGRFFCSLTAVDKAGNTLKTDDVAIIISSSAPRLTLSPENQWADFVSKKSFDFNLITADQIGIKSWKVELQDESGRVLKTFSGPGQPPDQVAWNGETNDGKSLEPGSLVKGTFTVVDRAGNLAVTDPVAVQLAPPAFSSNQQMTLKLTSVLFDTQGFQLSDDAKKELDKSVLSIRPYLNKSVLVIKGYAAPDETGDLTALSRQRAVEVRDYLAKVLGISPETIYAVGYAAQNLWAENASESNANRRRAVVTLSTQ